MDPKDSNPMNELKLIIKGPEIMNSMSFSVSHM